MKKVLCILAAILALMATCSCGAQKQADLPEQTIVETVAQQVETETNDVAQVSAFSEPESTTTATPSNPESTTAVAPSWEAAYEAFVEKNIQPDANGSSIYYGYCALPEFKQPLLAINDTYCWYLYTTDGNSVNKIFEISGPAASSLFYDKPFLYVHNGKLFIAMGPGSVQGGEVIWRLDYRNGSFDDKVIASQTDMALSPITGLLEEKIQCEDGDGNPISKEDYDKILSDIQSGKQVQLTKKDGCKFLLGGLPC